MKEKISKRIVTTFAKFNEQVEEFRKDTENGEFAELYEDAFTVRRVKDFKMTPSGVLSWVEDGAHEREQMFDDDEAREYLSFWKAALRRAKRYWAMDADTLDKIQDGEMEDIEEQLES